MTLYRLGCRLPKGVNIVATHDLDLHIFDNKMTYIICVSNHVSGRLYTVGRVPHSVMHKVLTYNNTSIKGRKIYQCLEVR